MKQATSSGIFITFEGTEGSGKSTLIKKLAKICQDHGIIPLCTREPGGIPMAEKLRDILLNQEMTPLTELFLYEAARSEHFQQIILPALIKGEVVFCDRFTDSTLAYQSHARGLAWKDVQKLNDIATQKMKPHLTILLDIDPQLGLGRVEDPNRFEAEGITFHKKVRQGYLKAMAQEKKRWLKINIKNQTPEQLAQYVFNKIIKKFPKYFNKKYFLKKSLQPFLKDSL